jgi:hypothetical protein
VIEDQSPCRSRLHTCPLRKGRRAETANPPLSDAENEGNFYLSSLPGGRAKWPYAHELHSGPSCRDAGRLRGRPGSEKGHLNQHPEARQKRKAQRANEVVEGQSICSFVVVHRVRVHRNPRSLSFDIVRAHERYAVEAGDRQAVWRTKLETGTRPLLNRVLLVCRCEDQQRKTQSTTQGRRWSARVRGERWVRSAASDWLVAEGERRGGPSASSFSASLDVGISATIGK